MDRNDEERYSRQSDIIPAKRLEIKPVTVIGVGAVGRQAALQLTAIGVTRLQLIDFDDVEESNIASQGYLEADLGKSKVLSTRALCRCINSEALIEIKNTKFKASDKFIGMVNGVVFCCVDKMLQDGRRDIWHIVKNECDFFCDSRMTAEALRIITVYDAKSRNYYPKTLFPDSEAQQGNCTAKSTIYCANIAAGLMVAQFTKYLRDFPIDKDISFNLLTTELSVMDEIQRDESAKAQATETANAQ